MFLNSCGSHITGDGLTQLRENRHKFFNYDISGDMFITEEFLDDYEILDGDFHFDFYERFPFIGSSERSFAWMSYDAVIYTEAKQALIASRNEADERLDGKTVNGVTFYMNFAGRFPDWFTAFGCNDETHTLVFLGFSLGFDNPEYEFCSLAETDFGAFLEHFYGEWYDWNISD